MVQPRLVAISAGAVVVLIAAGLVFGRGYAFLLIPALLLSIYVACVMGIAWLSAAKFPFSDAEKRQAVGQLGAGVAHEVKNPLMTLLTGVRYLQQHVPTDDPPVRTLLEDMQEAVKRADAVITGLLDYADPPALTRTPADLNAVVEHCVGTLRRQLLAAHVTLTRELSTDLPGVALDTPRFQQVLANVLTNAVHATPPQGTITVRTFPRKGRAGVVLEVDDTGSGIPADLLGRVFDPFFTTKAPGAGTGLGLAVSRQIVELHGASINITNRQEGGVRVTITFSAPNERGS